MYPRIIQVTVLLLAVSVLALSTAQAGLAPDQKALMKKVDSQLACYCGCSLTVSDCRVSMTCGESAKLEKEVISYIEAGLDEKAILAKMREKYGETILAAPTKEGFNITAWTFPFLAIALGGIIAFYYMKKWKATTPEMTGAATVASAADRANPANASDEYDSRVEEELNKLDQ
ncbi:MAG: cytochrome c-type biogenesis protein CcmH [candidate division KSB1 bacterium]|nr:cytochrome c-type biogenesis protein CcmH [candidate division KSB1 bacterium]MDQ7063476.1 cytochrome c-type biogenesis protein CcmH [candidate division KSB1 bacterium]